MNINDHQLDYDRSKYTSNALKLRSLNDAAIEQRKTGLE